ncbi:MAG: hypothetical protein IJD05_07035 [Bacteroidaceae bacterium]|nr:hypothetical protein [Bacteroidaceae bacterium]
MNPPPLEGQELLKNVLQNKLKELSLLKGDERVFPTEKISEGVPKLTDGNKNNNEKRTPPSKPRKLGTPLES